MAAGKPVTREANADWSRRLSGRRSGRAVAAERCGPLSATGSSRRASGLPWASAIRRLRTRGASAGKCWRSRFSDADSLSGATSWTGSPPGSKEPSVPSRAVQSRAPPAARRRATSPRTRALAGSSHWVSSTTSRVGPCRASCPISSTTASATASGSGAGPPLRPRATASASAGTIDGTIDGRACTAASISCPRTPWLSRVRYSAPVAARTCMPRCAARDAAAASRAVLPTPGSPRSSSGPP